jgi:hypothetical protein
MVLKAKNQNLTTNSKHARIVEYFLKEKAAL